MRIILSFCLTFLLSPHATSADEVAEEVEQIDSDHDGLVDSEDNCPHLHNPDQNDADEDGIGNFCDVDPDGDGYVGSSDPCRCVWNPPPQRGVKQGAQALWRGAKTLWRGKEPGYKKRSRQKERLEKVDIVCSPSQDTDDDGIPDEVDNCPFYPTDGEGNNDTDGDFLGDACDDDPLQPTSQPIKRWRPGGNDEEEFSGMSSFGD